MLLRFLHLETWKRVPVLKCLGNSTQSVQHSDKQRTPAPSSPTLLTRQTTGCFHSRCRPWTVICNIAIPASTSKIFKHLMQSSFWSQHTSSSSRVQHTFLAQSVQVHQTYGHWILSWSKQRQYQTQHVLNTYCTEYFKSLNLILTLVLLRGWWPHGHCAIVCSLQTASDIHHVKFLSIYWAGIDFLTDALRTEPDKLCNSTTKAVRTSKRVKKPPVTKTNYFSR
jgi:hypothetical protein